MSFSSTLAELEEEQALLSDRLLYRDNLGLLRNIAGFAALGAGGDLGQAVQRQACLCCVCYAVAALIAILKLKNTQ